MHMYQNFAYVLNERPVVVLPFKNHQWRNLCSLYFRYGSSFFKNMYYLKISQQIEVFQTLDAYSFQIFLIKPCSCLYCMHREGHHSNKTFSQDLNIHKIKTRDSILLLFSVVVQSEIKD